MDTSCFEGRRQTVKMPSDYSPFCLCPQNNDVFHMLFDFNIDKYGSLRGVPVACALQCTTSRGRSLLADKGFKTAILPVGRGRFYAKKQRCAAIITVGSDKAFLPTATCNRRHKRHLKQDSGKLVLGPNETQRNIKFVFFMVLQMTPDDEPVLLSRTMPGCRAQSRFGPGFL